MMRRPALCTLLILALSSTRSYSQVFPLGSDVQPQKSAPFSLSFRGDHKCVIELSGPISLGDSDRFKSFLQSLAKDKPFTEDYYRKSGYSDPEMLSSSVTSGFEVVEDEDGFGLINHEGYGICLNSEGGSFSEAIRLFDIVNDLGLGTVVPDGAECLSACAVVFLAGRLKFHSTMGGELITAKNRKLHGRALLGFHAPSLQFTVPNPPPEAIAGAYSAAVKQNAELINRLSDNELPILRRMLSTPPEQMFYITDVESSLAIEMDILGLKAPNEITISHVLAACANAALAYIKLVSKYEQLGRVRNDDPWPCEMPETYLEIDSGTPVKIVKTKEGMVVGEASVPAINCNAPNKKNVCRPFFSTNAYPYGDGTGDPSRFVKVSVGFWETDDTGGISLEDLPQDPDRPNPFFEWDSGTQILYSPSMKLSDAAQ